jgi:hypothetical protein
MFVHLLILDVFSVGMGGWIGTYFEHLMDWTDRMGRTDGRTDGWMDGPDRGKGREEGWVGGSGALESGMGDGMTRRDEGYEMV